jgi:superfamily I DNA/RNA helicase
LKFLSEDFEELQKLILESAVKMAARAHANRARAKKCSPAKRGHKVSARPTPGKAPEIIKTSEAERRKIIRKIMPLLRSGAALNYSDIGKHLRPQRDARCVKKIVEG